jgi:hypothetical protein
MAATKKAPLKKGAETEENDPAATVAAVLEATAPTLVAIGQGIRTEVGPVDLQRAWIDVATARVRAGGTAAQASEAADGVVKLFEERAADLAGRSGKLPYLATGEGPAQ